MEQTKNAWHPAFIEAIQMELDAYKDYLEFHPEYQLTSEPLKIDCVVIKKAKGVIIKKNLAAIFRDANILEYKSPDDYISVADYYKVYAYACLYASFEKVPITSLTMTFVESRYPRELLTHLKKIRGYKVEEKSPGIYTVNGDVLPIQIINSRRLSTEENLWLKCLSKRLEPGMFALIGEEATRHAKVSRINAYINIIARANFHAIEEARNMSGAAKSLDDVFIRTGLAAKWEAEGEARGEERKALDIAQNMVNLGFPLESVVSATMLEPEKVKALFEYSE